MNHRSATKKQNESPKPQSGIDYPMENVYYLTNQFKRTLWWWRTRNFFMIRATPSMPTRLVSLCRDCQETRDERPQLQTTDLESATTLRWSDRPTMPAWLASWYLPSILSELCRGIALDEDDEIAAIKKFVASSDQAFHILDHIKVGKTTELEVTFQILECGAGACIFWILSQQLVNVAMPYDSGRSSFRAGDARFGCLYNHYVSDMNDNGADMSATRKETMKLFLKSQTFSWLISKDGLTCDFDKIPRWSSSRLWSILTESSWNWVDIHEELLQPTSRRIRYSMS